MQFIKKNIIVLLAFALPILLIVGIAASTYLPGLLLSTEYDFVYSICGDASSRYYYPDDCDKKPEDQHFFLHETEANESREITKVEVADLELSSLLTSPDGVTVDSGYNYNGGEFFPFFDRSSRYGYYLSKGDKHRALNLVGGDEYYYNRGFKFIGWVVTKP